MEKPRVSPIINYGAVLQAGVLIITVGTLIWQQAVSTTEGRATAATVQSMKPVIDANTRTNVEQAMQLNAISATLAQLRVDQGAILSKLGVISEDMASVKERTKERNERVR